jgi:hypothetical protein
MSAVKHPLTVDKNFLVPVREPVSANEPAAPSKSYPWHETVVDTGFRLIHTSVAGACRPLHVDACGRRARALRGAGRPRGGMFSPAANVRGDVNRPPVVVDYDARARRSGGHRREGDDEDEQEGS